MTETEWNRLRELDSIIAWNKPEDGGRDLTEEEQEEHSRLFWQAMTERKERVEHNGSEEKF